MESKRRDNTLNMRRMIEVFAFCACSKALFCLTRFISISISDDSVQDHVNCVFSDYVFQRLFHTRNSHVSALSILKMKSFYFSQLEA